ncbi:hypothetical protein [Sphaerisporangium corydalis]|uniref:Phenylacetate--CoA ligase family protein n=1 Tax=Sphaerisporangium corydalis TaxID=1441875 RepID=A0ABV9EFX9_9ACTN|nr:hypothetical protein [Sphaerisporangium corydalis]
MDDSVRRLTRDARRAAAQGPEAIAARRRARLAEMVAHARAASPYYRELYQDLPERVEDPALLPVTTKRDLMGRFDEWVTDPEVTHDRVQAFMADPGRAGERFQGRYLVATTSGTSGLRGVFVLDDRNMAVNFALGSRSRGALGAGAIVKILTRAGRTAMVSAPGGHLLSTALTARLRKESRRGRALRVFSMYEPPAELYAELARYDPALVVSSPSMLGLLAATQDAMRGAAQEAGQGAGREAGRAAGRARLRPVLVIAGGETSTEDDLDRIAAAFGAPVHTAYAATECGFLAYGCERRWYHLNSDWAILEPVDAHHRPTPPGEPSHTALLTNLANRVQPILRYDLGDSVMARPDPCPCGNPLPAIRVQGRAADVLTFPTGRGDRVGITPMAFGTLLDRTAGVERFQIAQTTATTLRVRLVPSAGADPGRVWSAVHAEITRLLIRHDVTGVTLEHAEEPPQRSPGGKYRRIIPLA